MPFFCNKKSPKSYRNNKNINNAKDGWSEVLSEYAGSSTIHGVRYLTEPKRPLAERIWWIIAFLLSVTFCGIFITNIWNKWHEKPVIISFADRTIPVREIPFPAVTICPQTKFKSNIFDFTRNFKIFIEGNNNEFNENITEIDLRRMKSIVHLCGNHYVRRMLNFSETFTNQSSVDELRKFALDHSEIIFFCLWNNSNNCDTLFTTTLTNVGMCFTFNILNQQEMYRDSQIQKSYTYYDQPQQTSNWTQENGYSKDENSDPYPGRVLSSNKFDSLVVYLSIDNFNLDYSCSGPIQGFKILFHPPYVIPRLIKNFHHIDLEEIVEFKLTPKITKTSDELKNYSPNIRQCFYNKDKYLRFFNEYTQENCNLECLSNYTLAVCGCVSFSMPYAPRTPLCGVALIKCYEKAEHTLAIMNNFANHTCNCLPACTSIIYESEKETYRPDWLKFMKSVDMNFTRFTNTKLSSFSINFKENEFISSYRAELYGTTDFIADCGGLLGLFMGVSLLSIVEIIYFCTIRLISNFRMKKLSPLEENRI